MILIHHVSKTQLDELFEIHAVAKPVGSDIDAAGIAWVAPSWLDCLIYWRSDQFA